jgi:hypothetical protein
MAKINEEDPGGKKSQYLGNHVVTTEAGHMVEYDNTPGDRRINIRHASGTRIEIKDDGVRITKVEGKEQQIFNKGIDQVVTGNFSVIIAGDVCMHVTGKLKHEVRGDYEIVTHGDFKVKAAGKNIMEFGGDQRVQVNGKTSHRTSGDRETITGGNNTESVGSDNKQTIGGENTQIVASHNATLTGGEHQVVSAGGMGFGSGGQMGIASADIMSLKSESQIQSNAKLGTFIRDEYAINIISSGSGGALMAASGYKAGIFSKDHDVRIGAGGKLLVETDDGSKIDTAGLIPGIGGFYPS